MASLINFSYSTEEALSIIEEAINYTNSVTNNLLYDTGLNSPYRILLEAQVYIYNTFLNRLRDAEREIRLIFFELLGFTPKVAAKAKVRLKFELLEARPNDNTYFRQNFPVRAETGVIFSTDTILLIPAGNKIGYVNATCLKAGTEGNVGRFKVNQALQVIDVDFTVTNESNSTGGLAGESISDLQTRVGIFIRGSSILTDVDIYNYTKTLFPNLVLSIDSNEPGTMQVYACYANGDSLNPFDYNRLLTELERRKPLGLINLTVNNIQTVTTYMEVRGALRFPQDAPRLANDINTELRKYLVVSNPRQVDDNTKGIIILNELERVIGRTQIDYVSNVKIGLNPETAYGQNFIFDHIVSRVRLGVLKVILIKDDFTYEATFTS